MTAVQKVIKYCAVALAIFLIVGIVGGLLQVFGMISWIGDENTYGEMRTYQVSGDVTNLEIDIGASDFEIVMGDAFKVESNYKYLTVEEKGGRLVISQRKAFTVGNLNEVATVLTVPKDFVFKEADITAGAGRMNIEALSANELDIELGAGDTEIRQLNVLHEGEIDGGVGKLSILDGQLCNTDLNIGVGKLEMSGMLTGNSSVDCSVGSVELVLLGSIDDYRIELDKGIGEALLNGEAMNDDMVYGSGNNYIDIEGGIGSMNIVFQR